MIDINFNFEDSFAKAESILQPELQKSLAEKIQEQNNLDGIIGMTSGLVSGYALNVTYEVMKDYHSALMEFLDANYQRKP